MVQFFLLRSGEDGTTVEQWTEDKLLKAITPDSSGATEYGQELHFLSEVPQGGCFDDCPENSVLIIKGEIVVPKSVQMVKKYKF